MKRKAAAVLVGVGLLLTPGVAHAAFDTEICTVGPGENCEVEFEVGPGARSAPPSTTLTVSGGISGVKGGDCQPVDGVRCYIVFGFKPPVNEEMISWEIESESDYALILEVT